MRKVSPSSVQHASAFNRPWISRAAVEMFAGERIGCRYVQLRGASDKRDSANDAEGVVIRDAVLLSSLRCSAISLSCSSAVRNEPPVPMCRSKFPSRSVRDAWTFSGLVTR